MNIASASNTLISLLSSGYSLRSAGRINGAAEADSLIKAATTEKTKLSAKTDSVSIRMQNLGFAHSNLRASNEDASIEQARHTIALNVRRSLNSIQAELNEIEVLTDAISEGNFDSSQLADAQTMIEGRLALIGDIVAGTEHNGQALFTGTTQRVVTNPLSEAGFDVYYPEMGADTLEIDSIDVVNMTSSDIADMVSDAQSTLTSAISTVEAEAAHLESGLGDRFSTLESMFAELRSSEMLSAPAEDRWLETKNQISQLTSGELSNFVSSMNLNSDVVASLLK